MTKKQKAERKNADRTAAIFRAPKEVKGLPGKRFEQTDKWIKVLLPLKKKKNIWFQIAEYPTSSQAASSAQYLKKEEALVPPGVWEFASRTLDNDGGGLFARFVKE